MLSLGPLYGCECWGYKATFNCKVKHKSKIQHYKDLHTFSVNDKELEIDCAITSLQQFKNISLNATALFLLDIFFFRPQSVMESLLNKGEKSLINNLVCQEL